MLLRWWKNTWPYRELFFFLAWRDVKIRYRQTVLGAAWAVLQPLVTMLIFTVLFGRMAKVPSEGIPYPLFSYSGLLLWTYFSVALSGGAGALVGSSELIRKVYFPREALPAAPILAALVDLGVGMILLVGLMLYYHASFTWHLLFLPLLVLELLLFVMAVSLALAAVNVKYRDVKHALPFVIQLWMFLSPVIYPTNMVPERYRFLLALNPLTGIIETWRACIFPGRNMPWSLLEVSIGMTVLIFFLGASYFKSAERAFADVI
ncbi:MAG TPA: ABC transporter permease [Candidatus Dormibacteraeota bacterium]|nr:ABC transporter permease [Candidatus Dormibacteraeota bacterium]